MGPDACFGELSLIYTAPRAASVVALTDCEFWCLEGSLFKIAIKELIAQTSHIAKSLVHNLPLFSHLTKRQKDNICGSMLMLQYEKG